ncbi:MAG: hypothetical protein R2932_22885 [Caldilineaceae bacterium]
MEHDYHRDKVALVTGGSRGWAGPQHWHWPAKGCGLRSVRTQASLDETVAELQAIQPAAIRVVADLVDAAADTTAPAGGRATGGRSIFWSTTMWAASLAAPTLPAPATRISAHL